MRAVQRGSVLSAYVSSENFFEGTFFVLLSGELRELEKTLHDV